MWNLTLSTRNCEKIRVGNSFMLPRAGSCPNRIPVTASKRLNGFLGLSLNARKVSVLASYHSRVGLTWKDCPCIKSVASFNHDTIVSRDPGKGVEPRRWIFTFVSNIPDVSTLALRMSCSEGEKFSCRTVATFSKKYLAQSISCNEI